MMKKIFGGLLGLVLVLALAGCKAPTYTVTFQTPDKTFQQQVQEGQCPREMELNLHGITVAGWTDEKGAAADPMGTPVTADAKYNLVYYPELSSHVPYLFADGKGFINAAAELTCRQLNQALTTLAAEGAENYFPPLSASAESVTAEMLTETLTHFFPEEKVKQAVTGDTVTRGSFAAAMNFLLGRAHTGVLLEEGAQIPLDITQSGEYLEAVLEACMPHKDSPDGKSWEEVDLPTDLAPGFHNVEGWLYYVTEDRFFLKDGKVGDLYFGTDGRYTCGDSELDALVAEILKKMIAENPDKQGLDLLREAHIYCRDEFTYLRRLDNAKEVGETGWAAKDAKEMFQTGRGNCYNYAAAFWALARGLGYECYAISGTCTGTAQPHGWCLINLDGEDYFFDCEWEMAYRVQHDPPRYEMDMFMIPMSKAPFWSYKWTTY